MDITIPAYLKNTATGIANTGMKNMPGQGNAPQLLAGLMNNKPKVPDYSPLINMAKQNYTSAMSAPEFNSNYVDSLKISSGMYGPPSKSASSVVDRAKKELGDMYGWGATGPDKFDCSGLSQYVYKQFGVKLPRTAAQQFKAGTPVELGQLMPGDLVFFNGYKGKNGVGHVGIYAGGGKMVEAPKKNTRVRISDMANRKDYIGARRYL